jgi:hypothetical protein
MSDDNPLLRAVPRMPNDTGASKLTKTKGKLYWRVAPKDNVVTFQKAPKNTSYHNLSKVLTVYHSTFATEIKGQNRDRLQMQVLMAVWGNDSGRQDGRGKTRLFTTKVVYLTSTDSTQALSNTHGRCNHYTREAWVILPTRPSTCPSFSQTSRGRRCSKKSLRIIPRFKDYGTATCSIRYYGTSKIRRQFWYVIDVNVF